MKRFIIHLIALSLLGFYGCQNDGISDVTAMLEEKTGTYELSNDEVTELLRGYFQCLQSTNPNTRSTTPTIAGLTKTRYDNPVETRSGEVENNGFTICTVDVKDGEKDGFAIVVADKRFPVVLAYSPNGKYGDLKAKGGENLQKYIEDIPDEVKAVLAEPRYLTPDLTDTTKKFKGFPYYNNIDENYEASDINGISHDVALLKQSVLWGQRSPYNDSLELNQLKGDHFFVGCANIAMSQVMAYYKYPPKYNWNLMTKYVNIDGIFGVSGETYATIASFLKEMTGIMQTTFNEATNQGGTTIPNFVFGLQKLNYAFVPPVYYSSNAVKTSLKAKKFVVAFGQSPTGSGHAFVISGYWKFKIPTNMPNLSDGTNLGVNWGTAGGWGDGWYLVEYGNRKITSLGLAKIDPNTGNYIGKDFSKNLILVSGICPKQ